MGFRFKQEYFEWLVEQRELTLFRQREMAQMARLRQSGVTCTTESSSPEPEPGVVRVDHDPGDEDVSR